VRHLFCGAITKRHGQGSRFHWKEGDLPAAAVTPLSAINGVPVFHLYPAAQRIDPRNQIAVILEVFTNIHHVCSIADMEVPGQE
jgi:hypothetical protein